MKRYRLGLGWLLVLLTLVTEVAAQKEERMFIRKGNRQFADSAFVDAEVSYRKALDINPSSSIAMYNLGNALSEQNKLEDAMKVYADALRLEKDKSQLGKIYHNMGVIIQSQKDYAKAIEAYKQSLRNDPHSNETKYNLALCQKLLNDQEDQKDNDNQDQQQNQQKEEQDKKEQEKQQDQKEQNQNQQQNPQQPQNQEEKMSKENAEQLLRSVMQDEKDVQEKVKKQQVMQGGRLEKDW